jgi:hypothetical protein
LIAPFPKFDVRKIAHLTFQNENKEVHFVGLEIISVKGEEQVPLEILLSGHTGSDVVLTT